jgi:hypothetical protein
MPFNEGKLKELVVYIANKSKDDPAFGKTKLLKLLAYADFAAYKSLGQPITGATYIKLEHGPSSQEAPPALNLLRALGRIQIVNEDVFEHEQSRIVAFGPADESVFTADELAIADQVIETFQSLNNTKMADVSHRDFVGWQIAEEREQIPYETVFLAPPEPITEAERSHVHHLVVESEKAREAAAA